MLEKVRKPGKAKTLTAYLLFGAICLVFVFFGLAPNQFGFEQGGAAAVVNNHQISLAEFSRMADNLERQYGRQLEALPAAQRQMQTSQLRMRALEQLVDSELLYQSAKKEGLAVSDREVQQAIVNIPAFSEGGKFRHDYYRSYLQNAGYTPGQFEERIRKDIAVDKVRSLFLASFEPVTGEVEKIKKATNTKMNLGMVQFSQKMLEQALPISPDEIKKYLSQPENESKVKEYYESHMTTYSLPEEIKARHILVAIDPSDKESEKKANARLMGILEKLNEDNFAALAAEHSDDKASAKNGGDLGYFSRGRMVPEFEDAAFKLNVGEISSPIKTDYGLHVLQVQDKKEARTKTLPEVENEIARTLVAQSKVNATLERLKETVKSGDKKKLESELQSLGWKWEETGEFNLASGMIPKLGPNDQVLEAVAANPREGSLVPRLLEVGGNYLLVEVKKLELPKEEPSTEKSVAEFQTLRRAGEVFSSWLEAQKETASISRNNQLLTN